MNAPKSLTIRLNAADNVVVSRAEMPPGTEIAEEGIASIEAIPTSHKIATQPIATGAAVDYLEALGMDNVWAHEQQITGYALDRFAELEGINLLGPREVEDKGAVISFSHDSVHSHDLGTALDQLGIAIRTGHHCAMPLIRSHGIVSAARASFYIYNTEAEVDVLIDGLKEAERYFSKAGIA